MATSEACPECQPYLAERASINARSRPKAPARAIGKAQAPQDELRETLEIPNFELGAHDWGTIDHHEMSDVGKDRLAPSLLRLDDRHSVDPVSHQPIHREALRGADGAASEVQPKFTSHSDPASQWTAARKGPAFFSYSDNYLIDTDHGVIVGVEATRSIRQAEVGSTKTMLDRVKARFDLHPERLIADTAYGTGPMLGWLVDRKIAPHIPVFDKSGRSDGTWSRADFEWDAENDQYVCPEGQTLKQFRRNYSDPSRGPTGEGRAKYRALKLTCQACPSKPRCCPNADTRSITREEHEDARQIARDIAKTEQYAFSMKLRKKVEMLFAHLKRILGLGRLRLRGPCGANDEFLLAATAQNLRKLDKILLAPQQMRRA